MSALSLEENDFAELHQAQLRILLEPPLMRRQPVVMQKVAVDDPVGMLDQPRHEGMGDLEI